CYIPRLPRHISTITGASHLRTAPSPQIYHHRAFPRLPRPLVFRLRAASRLHSRRAPAPCAVLLGFGSMAPYLGPLL
ncbi:hypothetical protein U1Q18_014939, partial [Sarracenia purpurea var. burkii]